MDFESDRVRVCTKRSAAATDLSGRAAHERLSKKQNPTRVVMAAAEPQPDFVRLVEAAGIEPASADTGLTEMRSFGRGTSVHPPIGKSGSVCTVLALARARTSKTWQWRRNQSEDLLVRRVPVVRECGRVRARSPRRRDRPMRSSEACGMMEAWTLVLTTFGPTRPTLVKPSSGRPPCSGSRSSRSGRRTARTTRTSNRQAGQPSR